MICRQMQKIIIQKEIKGLTVKINNNRLYHTITYEIIKNIYDSIYKQFIHLASITTPFFLLPYKEFLYVRYYVKYCKRKKGLRI